MKRSLEQQIFELIHNFDLGKMNIFQNDDLCVIDTTSNIDYSLRHNNHYKVFHRCGYCWDIYDYVYSYNDIEHTMPCEVSYHVVKSWNGYFNIEPSLAHVFDLIQNALNQS